MWLYTDWHILIIILNKTKTFKIYFQGKTILQISWMDLFINTIVF